MLVVIACLNFSKPKQNFTVAKPARQLVMLCNNDDIIHLYKLIVFMAIKRRKYLHSQAASLPIVFRLS